MISKEQALERFQEIIGSKSEFAQLLKSQFIDHLSIFQSWALRQALWGLERDLQEFFISTALNRASILAGAEDREYVPIMPTPATGKIQIENRNSEEVNLPANQILQSGKQFNYVLDEAVSIPAESTVEDLAVTQKVVETYTETITEAVAFHEILFDAEKTMQICGFSVYVDLGEGNGMEQWAQARRFMNSDADSHVFDVFYSHLDQIGIRFGNGIFGKIPPIGAEIEVYLWLTEGNTTLLSGQRLQHVGTVLDDGGSPASLTITVSETIANGAGPEETESIRRNAHYAPIYNDSLVWAEDFIFFIKRHFPTILWINVWGETEAEEEAGYKDLDFVNTIFVSAYRTETGFTWRGAWVLGSDYAEDDVVTYGYTWAKWKCVSPHTAEDAPSSENTAWEPFTFPLETQIPEKLAELELLNKHIQWVDPVFSSFHLTITGEINPILSVGDVQTEIRSLLTANYGKDSATRKHHAYKKDFYDLINGTGYFEDKRAWFNVEAAGTFGETLLSEMVFIDLDETTIDLDTF